MAAEDDNESLRLSDDERLHALNALGEHYAAGRIDMSEFEDLSGRAADARRLGDLDGLFTGLPGGIPLAVSGGALVKRDIAVPAMPEAPSPEGKATPGKNLEPASDEAELDQLVTNRLILQPRGEMLLSAQDIPELGIGAGLAKVEAGVRLRYEFSREFAPYVGVAQEWRVADGGAGGEKSATRFVAGLRFWF